MVKSIISLLLLSTITFPALAADTSCSELKEHKPPGAEEVIDYYYTVSFQGHYLTSAMASEHGDFKSADAQEAALEECQKKAEFFQTLIKDKGLIEDALRVESKVNPYTKMSCRISSHKNDLDEKLLAVTTSEGDLVVSKKYENGLRIRIDHKPFFSKRLFLDLSYDDVTDSSIVAPLYLLEFSEASKEPSQLSKKAASILTIIDDELHGSLLINCELDNYSAFVKAEEETE